MKRILTAVLVVGVLGLPGCVKTPPNLTPAATSALTNTQVIKGLDLLRDTAVAAHDTIPPVLSTASLIKVVNAHEATLKVMDALGTGWQATVTSILTGLIENLTPPEQAIVVPYVNLVNQILAGIK
jgi:hypothetical protein